MFADRLPPYDPDATCPKCGHDVVGTRYERNSSHHGCQIGAQFNTGRAGEHLSRWCVRCHFTWEERVIDGEQATTGT